MNEQFTKRQIDIIRALVTEFVESGQPVGSKILLSRCGLKISSATVRKEMSILEQMGLLHSPHTSAGRIPTDLAYRFYVDDLLSVYEITLTEKARLEEFYQKAKMQLDQLLKETVHLLASASEYTGVVLSPVASGSIINRVELVSVRENMVLMIMVSGAGSVYQKKIQTEKALTQEELYKISRFFNARFKGYEISDLQDKGLEFLADYAGELGDLANSAILIGQSLVYSPPDQEVYIEGSRNLYNELYAAIPERAEDIVNRLEDKSYISEMFNRLKNQDQVSVQFGIDIEGERIGGISVIAKGYSIGGRNLGALGVIGPSRMKYKKLIPTLDYSSQILSEVFNERNEILPSENLKLGKGSLKSLPKIIEDEGYL